MRGSPCSCWSRSCAGCRLPRVNLQVQMGLQNLNNVNNHLTEADCTETSTYEIMEAGEEIPHGGSHGGSEAYDTRFQLEASGARGGQHHLRVPQGRARMLPQHQPAWSLQQGLQH